MMKKILIVCLAMLLVLSLLACGKSTDTDETTEPTTENTQPNTEPTEDPLANDSSDEIQTDADIDIEVEIDDGTVEEEEVTEDAVIDFDDLLEAAQ